MFYPLTFNYLLFLEREKTMINFMENNHEFTIALV